MHRLALRCDRSLFLAFLDEQRGTQTKRVSKPAKEQRITNENTSALSSATTTLAAPQEAALSSSALPKPHAAASSSPVSLQPASFEEDAAAASTKKSTVALVVPLEAASSSPIVEEPDSSEHGTEMPAASAQKHNSTRAQHASASSHSVAPMARSSHGTTPRSSECFADSPTVNSVPKPAQARTTAVRAQSSVAQAPQPVPGPSKRATPQGPSSGTSAKAKANSTSSLRGREPASKIGPSIADTIRDVSMPGSESSRSSRSEADTSTLLESLVPRDTLADLERTTIAGLDNYISPGPDSDTPGRSCRSGQKRPLAAEDQSASGSESDETDLFKTPQPQIQQKKRRKTGKNVEVEPQAVRRFSFQMLKYLMLL